MADLSKLILLTSVNTFKAENDVQTGSFVIGGSAPEMASTAYISRSFTVPLSVAADYYDIMINGPVVVDDYSYPWTVNSAMWVQPGRAMYRVTMNSPSMGNYDLSFEMTTSISGNILTITAASANQFLDPSVTLYNTTFNYRIIPYSATTQ